MTAIKSLDRTVEKWRRQSQAATPEYEAGVKDPRADWATQTAKAEPNYVKGVQAAIGRKSFGKGVRAAGTAKWQRGALGKGVTRWADGISASLDEYRKGFEPFRQVIESTTLPPRGPKGDPSNIRRVEIMAKALHDKKLSLQGGG